MANRQTTINRLRAELTDEQIARIKCPRCSDFMVAHDLLTTIPGIGRLHSACAAQAGFRVSGHLPVSSARSLAR